MADLRLRRRFQYSHAACRRRLSDDFLLDRRADADLLPPLSGTIVVTYSGGIEQQKRAQEVARIAVAFTETRRLRWAGDANSTSPQIQGDNYRNLLEGTNNAEEAAASGGGRGGRGGTAQGEMR